MADSPTNTTSQKTQSGRPFPAWRLPNGIKSASPEDLDRSDGSFERWIIGSGLVVVLGLLIEAGVAVCHPGYDSDIERIGTTISDWMVALGVAGEVLFAILARRVQTELRDRSNTALAKAVREAGEANERAAEARERAAKLETLLDWRRVTPRIARLLGEVLVDEPTASVVFSYSYGDAEANRFAHELAVVFRHWGWKTYFQPSMYRGEPEYELRVPLYSNGLKEAVAKSVRAALNRANLPNRTTLPEVVMWDDKEPVSEPSCELHIGPRPPVELE